MGTKALLFDMNQCGGCRKCVKACLDTHGWSGEPDAITELSGRACTALETRGDYSLRKLCRHCVDPCCVSACPAEALRKTDMGPVVYDPSICMGCRYCMISCPYDVPKYEWDEVAPAIQKCDMCYERIKDGAIPACADACPAGATVFGDRDELLAEAWSRIKEDPDEYHPHVYGENEYGGASVLFIAPFDLTTLGFVSGRQPSPARFTRDLLTRLPGAAVIGGAALLGLWWITRRRDKVMLEEGVLAAREERPASARGGVQP